MDSLLPYIAFHRKILPSLLQWMLLQQVLDISVCIIHACAKTIHNQYWGQREGADKLMALMFYNTIAIRIRMHIATVRLQCTI